MSHLVLDSLFLDGGSNSDGQFYRKASNQVSNITRLICESKFISLMINVYVCSLPVTAQINKLLLNLIQSHDRI